MKSKLFKILFGLCIFMIGINVHAETSNSYENMPNGVGEDTQSVVVGSVEAPVYNVNVYWTDLSFDWVYDSTTEEFGWQPSKECAPMSYLAQDEYDDMVARGVGIFTDDTCSTSAVEYSEETEYYAIEEREYVSLNIEDYSTNGQIVPSVEWTAAEDYNYVDVEFTVFDESCVAVESQEVYDVAVDFGIYSDSSCTTEATDDGFEADKYFTIVRENKILTTKEIPDSVRMSGAGGMVEVGGLTFLSSAFTENYYYLKFNLTNTTTPTTAPVAGDQIGTLTVSIRAK